MFGLDEVKFKRVLLRGSVPTIYDVMKGTATIIARAIRKVSTVLYSIVLLRIVKIIANFADSVIVSHYFISAC